MLWGYRPAAIVGRWAIARALPKDQKRSPRKKLEADKRKAPGWELKAIVQRADDFQLRQKPLYFTAKRQGGFWMFPILEPPTVRNGLLRAYLGQPEQ